MTLGMQDAGLDVNTAYIIVLSIVTHLVNGMMMIVKEKRSMAMEDNE
jgi:hypothetical protein